MTRMSLASVPMFLVLVAVLAACGSDTSRPAANDRPSDTSVGTYRLDKEALKENLRRHALRRIAESDGAGEAGDLDDRLAAAVTASHLVVTVRADGTATLSGVLAWFQNAEEATLRGTWREQGRRVTFEFLSPSTWDDPSDPESEEVPEGAGPPVRYEAERDGDVLGLDIEGQYQVPLRRDRP